MENRTYRVGGRGNVSAFEQPGNTRDDFETTRRGSGVGGQRTARIRELNVPRPERQRSFYDPLAGLLPYDQHRSFDSAGGPQFSMPDFGSCTNINPDFYQQPQPATEFSYLETSVQHSVDNSEWGARGGKWKIPYHYPLATLSTLSLLGGNRLFNSSFNQTSEMYDLSARTQADSTFHRPSHSIPLTAGRDVAPHRAGHPEVLESVLLNRASFQDISHGFLSHAEPEDTSGEASPSHDTQLPIPRATWGFLSADLPTQNLKRAAPDDDMNRVAMSLIEERGQPRAHMDLGRSWGAHPNTQALPLWLLPSLDDGDRDLAWYCRVYPHQEIAASPSKDALKEALTSHESKFRQTITNNANAGKRIVSDQADEIVETMLYCFERGVQLKDFPKLWWHCFSGSSDQKASGVKALLTQTKEVVDACCEHTGDGTGLLPCNPVLLQAVMDMQSPTKKLTGANVRYLKTQFSLRTVQGCKQLHAFANMFFGNGMFQRDDAEDLLARCALPGEDAATVLAAVTNMQRRKGMITANDFDALVKLCKPSGGSFNIRILLAITRMQNGKGMPELEKARDLLALCSDQNGNVDLDVLEAVAKVRFQKGVPTEAEFAEIVGNR